MPLDSNIDDVSQWTENIIMDFGFDSPDDQHGTVGMACADSIAEGIQELGDQMLGPDMEEWPINEPKYMKWKARNFSGERRTNWRTHQMLSKESLLGEVEVTRDQVTMKYGTGQVSPDEKRPDGITDTQKAELAHDPNLPPDKRREFYAIGEVAEDHVFDTVSDALENHLQRRANT